MEKESPTTIEYLTEHPNRKYHKNTQQNFSWVQYILMRDAIAMRGTTMIK